MPILRVAGEEIDLPRNVALLDTNVLVARFSPQDGLHDAALLTLEDDDRFCWLVTSPVIVEACGLLMSRQGVVAVVSMLRWLLTPGNRVILLSCIDGAKELERTLPAHVDLIAARQIDFVDAHLMIVANALTILCNLAPNLMPIVTSDSRDFYVARGAGFRYGVLDFREPGGDVIPVG